MRFPENTTTIKYKIEIKSGQIYLINLIRGVVECFLKEPHLNRIIQLKHPRYREQAISARERALCQLTVCFEFQIRSERRKGHQRCALQMSTEK